MQIKIIVGTDYNDLTTQVNEYLKRIKVDDANVDVDNKNIAAVVSFKEKEVKAICAECRFFDDSGQPDSLMGLCQRKGKRIRFNGRPCDEYLDVRG